MARRRPGDPAGLYLDMLVLAVEQLAATMVLVVPPRETDGPSPGPGYRDKDGRYLLITEQAALVNGLAAIVNAERVQ